MSLHTPSPIVTPLCKRLGIRHPIFGFSHSAEVCLEIAKAGGFPVMGLSRELPENISQILQDLNKRMNGLPYGVDLMLPPNVPAEAQVDDLKMSLPTTHTAFVSELRKKFAIEPPSQPNFFTSHVRSRKLFDEQIEQVLASGAFGIATAIGLREDLIQRAKAAGKVTFSLVGSTRHAHKALEMGIDVLVAQGYDAGGHTGPVGTMSLVPQILEIARDVPVLAAGGIATGAQILGALSMGAQGAWLGTLWMAAKENHTPPGLLKRLIDSRSEDTLITRAHSGKPCRVVRSDWISAWEHAGSPLPLGMPLQQVLTGDVFASIHEHDRADLIYEAAGQSVFAIHEETTIRAQMDTLVSDLRLAWDRMNSMAQQS